jgi:NADH:ubiquinone oxidoreductase subunit 2 (subunit N)
VLIALVASTISLYYYLQVIKQMYLYQPEGGETERWRLTPTGYLATGALLVGVVWVGVYATPFYAAADRAIAPLFS